MTEYMDHIALTEFVENNIDYFFYEVVLNRSLDMTIEMLGVEVVERQVQRLHELRAIAEEHCNDVAIFPCTDLGPKNPESAKSCYFSDIGCGHECIQNILRQRV